MVTAEPVPGNPTPLGSIQGTNSPLAKCPPTLLQSNAEALFLQENVPQPSSQDLGLQTHHRDNNLLTCNTTQQDKCWVG